MLNGFVDVFGISYYISFIQLIVLSSVHEGFSALHSAKRMQYYKSMIEQVRIQIGITSGEENFVGDSSGKCSQTFDS